MKGRLFIALAALQLGICSPIHAETTFRLWSGPPPGSEHWRHPEITYYENSPLAKVRTVVMVRNVIVPTLTAYFADQRSSAPRTAVIICPGGGLRWLSWQIEGTDLAKWFANRGVTSFVLKYRLIQTSPDPKKFEQEAADFLKSFSRLATSGTRPSDFSDIFPDAASRQTRILAAADAREALRYVRAHASEWQISPDRIGMLGFSAGAFLVSDLIAADDFGSRPNFAVLLYGGQLATREIPRDAPPLFVAVAQDDPWMSGLAVDLFSRWDHAGKSIEFHYFDRGGHGFPELAEDRWMSLIGQWMVSRNLMNPYNE